MVLLTWLHPLLDKLECIHNARCGQTKSLLHSSIFLLQTMENVSQLSDVCRNNDIVCESTDTYQRYDLCHARTDTGHATWRVTQIGAYDLAVRCYLLGTEAGRTVLGLGLRIHRCVLLKLHEPEFFL